LTLPARLEKLAAEKRNATKTPSSEESGHAARLARFCEPLQGSSVAGVSYARCTMEGWVKLHRKLLKSRVFANEKLFRVWIWCLLRADHKACWVPVRTGRGITEVRLHAGQFIFGRRAAAKELRMPPSTVWAQMEKLKNMQNLDIQLDHHYSVVTICNWETYQQDEKAIEPPTCPPTVHHPTQTRMIRSKGSVISTPRNKHIGLFPEIEDAEQADNEPPTQGPEHNGRSVADHFEHWWATVRKIAPHKATKKQQALKKYRLAVQSLKAKDDPHAFLLNRASAYYRSQEGQSVYASGASPWLNQGRWDDDPASWGPGEQPGYEDEEIKPL